MYPVTKGYSEVIGHLDRLRQSGCHAEHLLAAVFVFEKTVKRIVKFNLINRGFTTRHCEELLKRGGFHDLVGLFPIFDRDGKNLHELIAAKDWQHVKPAVTMRNKLVHGERVFTLPEYQAIAPHVRDAAGQLRQDAIDRLECDPWAAFPRATANKLQWLSIRQPAPNHRALTD